MIDVGQGYRLLERDEIVIDGDQMAEGDSGHWINCFASIGIRAGDGSPNVIFRRPITQEKEDAE